MSKRLKFEAGTVGELIAELQKLEPDMRLAQKDSCGFFQRGIEFEQLELMRSRSEPHLAAMTDDPLWKKWKDRDFDMTFSALVVW